MTLYAGQRLGLSVEPGGGTSLPGSRYATAGEAPNNVLYRWWDWSFGAA